MPAKSMSGPATGDALHPPEPALPPFSSAARWRRWYLQILCRCLFRFSVRLRCVEVEALRRRVPPIADSEASRHSSRPVAGSYPRMYRLPITTNSVRHRVAPYDGRAPRRAFVTAARAHSSRPRLRIERNDEGLLLIVADDEKLSRRQAQARTTCPNFRTPYGRRRSRAPQRPCPRSRSRTRRRSRKNAITALAIRHRRFRGPRVRGMIAVPPAFSSEAICCHKSFLSRSPHRSKARCVG